MPRPRSLRPERRARQVALVAEQLRRDPHTPVPELAAILRQRGLGVHLRTVYRFRDEARATLPATHRAAPASGWPLTVAAERLQVRRERLRRMVAVVGMPEPQVDRATGVQRWPEADWRALEGRFEAAVMRRAAVVERLSPGHPYVEGLQLPPPAGQDGHGHWWLPVDVEPWVASGSARQPRLTWSRRELAEAVGLHPDGVGRLCELAGFPNPDARGRWDAAQVRAFVRTHHDWKDQVAGEATLDMRAAAAYVSLEYATVRRYRSTRGDWPLPDGWHGRMPRWSIATLQSWVAERA